MSDTPAPATATSTVNRVVMFLGSVALLGVAGMILLAMLDKPVPDNLTNVTVAAVAAEAALLASSRSVDPIAVQQAGYQAAVQDVIELDPPDDPPAPAGGGAAGGVPPGGWGGGGGAGWPPQPAQQPLPPPQAPPEAWPPPPPHAAPYEPQHAALQPPGQPPR